MSKVTRVAIIAAVGALVVGLAWTRRECRLKVSPPAGLVRSIQGDPQLWCPFISRSMTVARSTGSPRLWLPAFGIADGTSSIELFDLSQDRRISRIPPSHDAQFESPMLVVGDVDGDGFEDVFVTESAQPDVRWKPGDDTQ